MVYVYLVHCRRMSKEWFSWFFSGDVFVGRKGKSTNPHGMNMFGHFIVKAVFLQLIEDYKIASPDTKVQRQFQISNTTCTPSSDGSRLVI